MCADIHKLRGNALPLALMMTTLMLLAGFGLGLVVVEQAKRSIETDQAVQSYYMAYSGIESQLHSVRKNNASLASLSTPTGMGNSYLNRGEWISTTGLEKINTKTVSLVKENQFTTLDLYDPDSASVASGVCKVTVTWFDDPLSCQPGESSYIEASYGYWTVEGGIPKWPSDEQFKIMTKSNVGNQSKPQIAGQYTYESLPMSISGLSPQQAYRIRLRAYNCNAKNIVMQAYALDTDGSCTKTNFDLPGDITLSAQGNYRLASQKITVTMPKQDVLSGAFSYVVFSECTIAKGEDVTIDCPP